VPSNESNPLIDSGKPLFFRAADGGAIGLDVPPPRLGEAVRVAVRALGGMQKEALVRTGRVGTVWRLASDEGGYLAGLDEAPCPLSFLTVGMISSYMNEILALAKQRDIALDGIRLVQDNYYTMRGSARAGTMVGGAKNVRLTAQIASATDRDALTTLVAEAVAASPINGLMRGTQASLFSLTHNGKRLDPARAQPLEDAEQPLADETFDKTAPAAGDWNGLVRRGPMTPKAEHTVTMANDSLAESQDRLLHLRGICTLRADGVKEIEQQLYNPHGSIFHFLCDEAPQHGGLGLAPDAVSFISAGIAFCFMTQFGRYASIARKPLTDYRIIQDTHFSLGGASGGTHLPGKAEAVESHVHLVTEQDDDFARSSLDMAEQTCFLHAFCKTDVKTIVNVQPFGSACELPAVLA
jgi:organic hydroperoxide reductase OsmC/OhrA